jgi:hypothetical protein
MPDLTKYNRPHALIQTCAQIRYEARSALYALAIFEFGGGYIFDSETVSKIGAENYHAIESMTFSKSTMFVMEACLFRSDTWRAETKDEISSKVEVKPASLKHVYLPRSCLVARQHCEYDSQTEIMRYMFGKEDLVVHFLQRM